MPASTPLEFALLSLLRLKPQSGYDLRKTFSSTPMRHHSDSPGSIYPALRRLQAKKWISGAHEAGSARKRHLYRVTPSGRKALAAWLSRPVSRDEVIWERDQLLLRFAFLDGNVPRAAALELLLGMQREIESYLRDLRQYAADSGVHETGTTGALAFSFGIENYEAMLSWVRRARRQLAGEARLS